MQEHSLTWRAPAAALLAVIAYVLLSAAGAGAQVTINETDISIENSGTGDANTGRNALVANDSVNTSTSTQTATEVEDGVIFQSEDVTNESEGEASLETGNATAVGNIAKNAVVQATAAGSTADALIAAAVGTPYGPSPISPLVEPDEAPSPTTAEESTGSEEGIETDDEGEDPEAGEPESAATEPSASEASGGAQPTPASSLPNSGSAAADAGTPDVPALATSPLDNTVMGAVSGAGPPGVTTTTQNVDVDNDGDATANTGENTVVDGDVLTGNATATGNHSETMTAQLIAALGDLNLVDQDIDVDNDGDAVANTGANTVEGGSLDTGDATAAGNISGTAASQTTMAHGDLNQVDQDTEVENDGDAAANTGLNTVADGDVETGDADAAGNVSETATAQTTLSSGAISLVDQDTDVDNDGDAAANTGLNVVDEGDVTTGNATALGNKAKNTTSQFAVTEGDLNQIDQAIDVDNEGDANADTGNNVVTGGDLETGDADAAGSISANAAFQFTMAAGDQNLVDQAIDLDNEGDAVAETGENEVEDGEVATGDATATGNWAGTALGQRVITPSSEEHTDIDQAIEGENVGNAHADTGENLAVAGDGGEATILTGNALAIGNRSALAASQDA